MFLFRPSEVYIWTELTPWPRKHNILSPAMNYYRMIASPSLNSGHFYYYISDTAEVGAVTIRTPVGDV